MKYGHCVLCLDQGEYSGVRSDLYLTVFQCGFVLAVLFFFNSGKHQKTMANIEKK